MILMTRYLQMQGKNVFLIITTWTVTLQNLSKYACTMHSQFRMPIHGYLSAFTTTNNILQTLKHANVIIIDVMSVIISIIYVMCNRTTLKQTHDTMNQFTNVFLLLLVGDLGQLLAICKYFYF